jgi:hypothetical protein
MLGFCGRMKQVMEDNKKNRRIIFLSLLLIFGLFVIGFFWLNSVRMETIILVSNNFWVTVTSSPMPFFLFILLLIFFPYRIWSILKRHGII